MTDTAHDRVLLLEKVWPSIDYDVATVLGILLQLHTEHDAHQDAQNVTWSAFRSTRCYRVAVAICGRHSHGLEHARTQQPRRGKMCRLESAETGSLEKKVCKWTMEETHQLVDGCNKVFILTPQ